MRSSSRAAALLILAICGAVPTMSRAEPSGFDAGIEREFVDGMTAFAARDYRHAEVSFRKILDQYPTLLRVRLELARTLFMEKKDEQADYQFRLAAAARSEERRVGKEGRGGGS